MATTTPNFGWDIPQSTDLVKDGATAIAALGNDIDTSMVDLKGGTTGQVLSKASNTDMDFTWVAQDDSNAIQNAIVDAKGDLISATAADTPARLAVGSNGEMLLADSSTSTGLRWQGLFAAGKNKIINGNFGIWQRGITLNGAAGGAYLADRWKLGKDGTNTVNVTQQTFTPGTAPVSGYESQYFIRASIASTGTLTFLQFSQPIEDVRTFAGQTITVSFWAKGSANASGLVYAGQNFGSGGSTYSEFGYPSFNLTTSWTRFSVNLTVPSVSGKTIGTSSYLEIFIRGGLTANGSTFDLWGVQVEAGSVATPFTTATGTIQDELAACQRYYWRNSSTVSGANYGTGVYYNTTDGYFFIKHPITMRTSPSFGSTSATLWTLYSNGASKAPSALVANSNDPNGSTLIFTVSGATGGNGIIAQTNSTTLTFIEFSAEL